MYRAAAVVFETMRNIVYKMQKAQLCILLKYLPKAENKYYLKKCDARGTNLDILPYLCSRNRELEQLVARRAHNPKATGSSPVLATIIAAQTLPSVCAFFMHSH